MPSLAQALSRVERALASTSAITYMTHVLVRGGYVYATNDRLLARSPCDLPIHFLAPAKELKQAISDSSTFELGNRLTVKTGRTKVNITVRSADEYPDAYFPNSSSPLTPAFLQILMRARRYVANDAQYPWAMGAQVDGNRIFVTDTKTLARFELPEPAPIKALLPNWVLEFLSTAPSLPSTIAAPINAEGTQPFIVFGWPDGTAVRGLTINQEFDPRASSIVDQVPDNLWEIPGDWRSAFAEVTRAVRGMITIHPNKMVVDSTLSDAEIEIETPTSDVTRWSVDRFEEVLRDATHIQLTSAKAFWSGRNVKGLMAVYTEGGESNARN